MKKIIVCSMFSVMTFLSSFSATSSWDNREGNWLKWNLENVPDGTKYVLLFAKSSEFDSPIWLNTGTMDWQLKNTGGRIGGIHGGTKQDLDKWWIDGNTQLYVECFSEEAEVYKWSSADYQPYKSRDGIGNYVIARSDMFTTEYLASGGYIGKDSHSNYFDFSSSTHSTPEPSSSILMLIGLSLLSLKRKNTANTANNCPCFKILENNAKTEN